MDDADDVPRHTHGFPEALDRLKHSLVSKNGLFVIVNTLDLALLIREYEGVAQFDPR